MAPIVESIEISRRPEDVFSYATDPSRLPEWQESAVSVRREGDAALAVGSRVVVTRRIGRREQAMTVELTELNPPSSWAVRGIDGPVRGIVKGEEPTASEAAKALEQPALWVGARFSSLPLARIQLEQVQTDYTDGSKHNGNKLELTYGALSSNGRPRQSQPWLIVDEAASVAASYQLGFNDGGDPPAPAGSMVINDNSIFARPGAPAIPERAVWTGKLIRGGIYVELSASSRDLLLAAARALTELVVTKVTNSSPAQPRMDRQFAEMRGWGARPRFSSGATSFVALPCSTLVCRRCSVRCA